MDSGKLIVLAALIGAGVYFLPRGGLSAIISVKQHRHPDDQSGKLYQRVIAAAGHPLNPRPGFTGITREVTPIDNDQLLLAFAGFNVGRYHLDGNNNVVANR